MPRHARHYVARLANFSVFATSCTLDVAYPLFFCARHQIQAINPTIPTAPRINVARALIPDSPPSARWKRPASVTWWLRPGNKAGDHQIIKRQSKSQYQPEMIAGMIIGSVMTKNTFMASHQDPSLLLLSSYPVPADRRNNDCHISRTESDMRQPDGSIPRSAGQPMA